MDERARKTVWRESEDLFILGAVRRFGSQWSQIAAHLPGRSEDAVRNRWHRLQKLYLTPERSMGYDMAWMLQASEAAVNEMAIPVQADRGRVPWTEEEDRIIIDGVRLHGYRWRVIAAALPGRSDSSARNRWFRLQKERQEEGCEGSALAEEVGHLQQAPCQSTIMQQSTTIQLLPKALCQPMMPLDGCSRFVSALPVAQAQPISH